MTMVESVETYLQKLERSKEGKPEQIRDAIDIYLGLWRNAIEKGVISAKDDVESALEKIESAGGLYGIEND
jgi:hypothetical protein